MYRKTITKQAGIGIPKLQNDALEDIQGIIREEINNRLNELINNKSPGEDEINAPNI